jgi:hypothetical protein
LVDLGGEHDRRLMALLLQQETIHTSHRYSWTCLAPTRKVGGWQPLCASDGVLSRGLQRLEIVNQVCGVRVWRLWHCHTVVSSSGPVCVVVCAPALV